MEDLELWIQEKDARDKARYVHLMHMQERARGIEIDIVKEFGELAASQQKTIDANICLKEMLQGFREELEER